MKRFSPNKWLGLAVLGGLLYPLLVYFNINRIPPLVFICLALALMGIRLLGLRHTPDAKMFTRIFCLAALGLIGLSFFNVHLAVRTYPILVSLAVSVFFGVSLIYPPSLVERIARLAEPDLSPDGVLYTRKVTIFWMLLLWGNALISGATVLLGSLAQWTLWNGLLSYLVMGTAFLGEWIIRQKVRHKRGGL